MRQELWLGISVGSTCQPHGANHLDLPHKCLGRTYLDQALVA